MTDLSALTLLAAQVPVGEAVAFWVLAPLALGRGRLVRAGAQPGALGAVPRGRHALPGRVLRDPVGALPGRGADHRLHRRHHDPLPLRAHARGRGLGGLPGGDPPGAARGCRHRRARRCWCCCAARWAPPCWTPPSSGSRRPTSRGTCRRWRCSCSATTWWRSRWWPRCWSSPPSRRWSWRTGSARPGPAGRASSQKELSRRRFDGSTHPAPLPGPGVYARHNAVDRPALLPDGSIARASVPPSMEARLPSPGEPAAQPARGAVGADRGRRRLLRGADRARRGCPGVRRAAAHPDRGGA